MMRLLYCLPFLGLIACSSTHVNQEKNGIHYFDYAASAHVSSEALAEFIRVSELDGNSSGINLHSQKLKEIERKSAVIIANKINAEGENIIFTNSATIANNIAILGVGRNSMLGPIYKYRKNGERNHFITTKIEHKSVLNVFNQLENEGFEVTYLDVDATGKIDLNQLKKSLKPTTVLISIQMFNSEIGTMQDMEKIGEIASQNGILFHSDASQAFGKYQIDVEKFHLDFLTISGYKIGAPKGIAALYVRNKEVLQPILFGSGNELFPGTKPTALIASFAKAVETYSIDMNKVKANYVALENEIKKICDIHINSTEPSHVFSVSIDGVLLGDVLERIRDYSFSSGCSCLGQGQSNVMKAIDPEGKIPTCTLRISFSDKTNQSELVTFAQKLKQVVNQLRKEKSVSNSCEKKKKSKELIDILNKIK